MPATPTRGLPPGTPTPKSGIYEQVGPRGGATGAQADSTKGNPLPPAPKGRTWDLVKPAHHNGRTPPVEAALWAGPDLMT